MTRLRAALADFDARDIHIIKEASPVAVEFLGAEIQSHLNSCEDAERTIAELKRSCS